jgi:hypothetical protein
MMIAELNHVLQSLGESWVLILSPTHSRSLTPTSSPLTNQPPLIPGEKLDKDEAEDILKDCADPEDEDGFFPYARELPCLMLFSLNMW